MCSAAILLVVVITVVVMVASAFRNNIIAEEIFLDSLPQAFEGYQILFITDIHRRRLPSQMLSPLIGKVNAVFLGGDITEKNSPLNRVIANMTLCTSIAPTYVVYGNHDYRANIQHINTIISNCGARLLMDENIAMEWEGSTLWLTGVDSPKGEGKPKYVPLPPLDVHEAADCCRIILVHDPLWLSQQLTVPADLILSGHTHGGQVLLPFFGRRHVETFYHKYSAGMYQWPKGEGTKSFAKLLLAVVSEQLIFPFAGAVQTEMHVLTLRRGQ